MQSSFEVGNDDDAHLLLPFLKHFQVLSQHDIVFNGFLQVQN